MPLTKTCDLAGPDPACLPLAIAVISGRFMSERIDVRGDIKIAGTSGGAVCGEVTALTRWVPAGQAFRSPAGAVAHRASGCAEEFAADEVVAAAEDGSAAMLSRPLPRFEALTTALWTVQSDLRPAWPAPGCARRTADLLHLDLNHAGRHPMTDHHLHQHVEVSDDGRTVAAAEVIISEESGGTARVSLRAEAGHITPGRRASLVDAVLDLPQVRESARLEAAFPLGDGESLQRLQQRCEDVTTRQAGSSALLDASLRLGGPGPRGRS